MSAAPVGVLESVWTGRENQRQEFAVVKYTLLYSAVLFTCCYVHGLRMDETKASAQHLGLQSLVEAVVHVLEVADSVQRGLEGGVVRGRPRPPAHPLQSLRTHTQGNRCLHWHLELEGASGGKEGECFTVTQFLPAEATILLSDLGAITHRRRRGRRPLAYIYAGCRRPSPSLPYNGVGTHARRLP